MWLWVLSEGREWEKGSLWEAQRFKAPLPAPGVSGSGPQCFDRSLGGNQNTWATSTGITNIDREHLVLRAWMDWCQHHNRGGRKDKKQQQWSREVKKCSREMSLSADKWNVSFYVTIGYQCRVYMIHSRLVHSRKIILFLESIRETAVEFLGLTDSNYENLLH